MKRGTIITTSMVSLALTGALAGSGADAQSRERGATVILKCQYLAGEDFRTTVAGVEVAGAVGRRLLASLAPGVSCAEAFNWLGEAGYEIVHSTTRSGDGVVDAADYTVWRSNFGAGG